MHALLSFMLAGGTLAGTAFAQTNDSSNSNVRPITNVSNVINTEAVYKKIEAARKNLVSNREFKEEDRVRVIVELEGETPIEYASKKGLLYKELPQSTKDQLEAKALNEQENVKKALEKENVDLKLENSFTTVINGFSGEVRYGDIDTIKSISNVKDVYISNEYYRPQPMPNLKTSHQFIQSQAAWADAGYKGEGTVIAVIDTGVDPNHKDFKLTDPSKESLTKDKVEKIIQDKQLKGKFYTDKVPYGYNYFDKNNEILDLGPEASMHGMHVAGITAANGDEIKGVAPEAQVLAMKVFSNDPEFPSTYDDIYIKAIDDAIKLGADVINMSLGSTAAFYNEGDIANQAITRAVNNGIVVSVSAGNSGHIAYGYGNPLAQNPDIGVVGAPGLSRDSIQVAATGNERYLYETNISAGGVEGIGYGVDNWVEAFAGKELELVSLGGKYGAPEDYEGVDVKGKIVLVKRGVLSFYDKTRFAAEAGAAGIIVYNNGGSTFYKDQGGWGLIPFMKVQTDVGQALENAIQEAGGTLKLEISEHAKHEDPSMGRMTDFTSWGTTPSLQLKPEISAPGGNIYSTLQNNQYGYMSGTSMAAPQVSGGAALVMQYLKAKHPELSASERSRLAKVLLMNTAKIITDLNGQPFSPRRQGAGMMQVYAAVTTPVHVVNKETNEAKVELGDFQTKTFSFTLVATNESDQDVTYKVNTRVLTDTIKGKINALIAGDMNGAQVEAPKTITIPAKGMKEFTITVDLTNAKIPGLDANGQKVDLDLKEDIFVEGFVTLEHETLPDLTIPYVGFYGKWDRPNILDGFVDLGEESFYKWAGMLDKETYFLEPNTEHEFAISPNGDGYNDEIQPLPSFLRNAKEVQYNIVDENGNVVRRIKTEYDVRKNFIDGGKGLPYSYRDGRIWDGTAKFKPVQDGKYYYQIKAKVDYKDAQWQEKKIPVIVDTIAPHLDVQYDEEKNTISWTTVEEGAGVRGYDILVNGESILEDLLPADTKSYQLPEQYKNAFVAVVAVDYAMNIGYNQIVVGDKEVPVITLLSPEPLSADGDHDVEVFGLVEDGTGIRELKVNGQPVEVLYDDQLGSYFKTVLTFDSDGPKDISVEATDYNNNKISINRTVFIDTTPGEITFNTEIPKYVDADTDKFTLDVTLHDNYRQMEFYVDDNFAYGIDFVEPLVMDGHTHRYTEDLPLQDGLNTFVLTLKDLGGHTTQKVVNIYKLKEGEQVPEAHITEARITPELYVSEHRPALLEAYADDEITWEVTIEDPRGNKVTLPEQKGTTFTAQYQIDKLAANGQYTVTFGGRNAAGQEIPKVVKTFTVYNYSTLIDSLKVLNSKGEEQTTFNQSGIANIKAQVQNLESFDVSPMLVIQVLDSNNKIVGKAFLTMDVLTTHGANGLGMQLPLSTLEKGTYKVEAFVWSGWDMNALAEGKSTTFKVE
ncbi:S8/S53 family peptidase [Geobacillus lituanicus]|nr:S8/S53 family peptidase [Geobacillus lituanicus]